MSILLNMIWPATYVVVELWRFWFLVIATIIIETLTIRFILKYPWGKSFIASLIGNAVSGFAGTFIMTWAMIFWHLLVDSFLPKATFDIVNWIATYILMCIGSVFLEVLTIKLIFKDKIKKLFIPLLIGNLLTYGFIAFVMMTKFEKDSREADRIEIFYKPEPDRFVLLDSAKLNITNAKIDISLDKDSNMIDNNYSLRVEYEYPYYPFCYSRAIQQLIFVLR